MASRSRADGRPDPRRTSATGWMSNAMPGSLATRSAREPMTRLASSRSRDRPRRRCSRAVRVRRCARGRRPPRRRSPSSARGKDRRSTRSARWCSSFEDGDGLPGRRQHDARPQGLPRAEHRRRRPAGPGGPAGSRLHAGAGRRRPPRRPRHGHRHRRRTSARPRRASSTSARSTDGSWGSSSRARSRASSGTTPTSSGRAATDLVGAPARGDRARSRTCGPGASASRRAPRRAGRAPTGSRTSSCARAGPTSTTTGWPGAFAGARPRSAGPSSRSARSSRSPRWRAASTARSRRISAAPATGSSTTRRRACWRTRGRSCRRSSTRPSRSRAAATTSCRSPTWTRASEGALIGAGDLFAMTRDTPGGRALTNYLISPEAQRILVANGGALSGNLTVDEYPDSITRRQAELLASATHFRFDASDSMPDEMNEAFWQAILSYTAEPSRLDDDPRPSRRGPGDRVRASVTIRGSRDDGRARRDRPPASACDKGRRRVGTPARWRDGARPATMAPSIPSEDTPDGPPDPTQADGPLDGLTRRLLRRAAVPVVRVCPAIGRRPWSMKDNDALMRLCRDGHLPAHEHPDDRVVSVGLALARAPPCSRPASSRARSASPASRSRASSTAPPDC